MKPARFFLQRTRFVRFVCFFFWLCIVCKHRHSANTFWTACLMFMSPNCLHGGKRVQCQQLSNSNVVYEWMSQQDKWRTLPHNFCSGAASFFHPLLLCHEGKCVCVGWVGGPPSPPPEHNLIRWFEGGKRGCTNTGSHQPQPLPAFMVHSVHAHTDAHI